MSSVFAVKYWFYDLVKVTAALPGMLALRPKIIYESEKAREKIKGGAILISNHTGFMDPVYLMAGIWYRRHHFVCAQLFFEGKLRWLFKHFLCIPVNRENVNIGSFNEVVNHLKAGDLVCMFPEGHINRDGDTGEFKPGTVLMALRGKAPVVPVYVKKRAHWWNRVKMAVGEPMDIAGMLGKRPKMADIENVTRLLYEKECGLRELAERNCAGSRSGAGNSPDAGGQ